MRTPHLTLRWYTWRAYLILLALVIIWSLLGLMRVTKEKNITRMIQSEEVTQTIDGVWEQFSQWEQILIDSSGTLKAQPSTITFHQDSNSFFGVDTNQSCEDFFNTGKQWLLATTNSLCTRDSSRKQQIITRKQVLEMQKEIDFGKNTQYPSIQALLTQSPILINQTTLQALAKDLRTLQSDPNTAKDIHKAVSIVRTPIMIGVAIASAILVPILLVLFVIVPLAIYTRITQLCMQKWFNNAFQHTRLIATLIIIATHVIHPLKRRMWLVWWIIYRIIMISQNKNSSDSNHDNLEKEEETE